MKEIFPKTDALEIDTDGENILLYQDDDVHGHRCCIAIPYGYVEAVVEAVRQVAADKAA